MMLRTCYAPSLVTLHQCPLPFHDALKLLYQRQRTRWHGLQAHDGILCLKWACIGHTKMRACKPIQGIPDSARTAFSTECEDGFHSSSSEESSPVLLFL